MTLDLARMKKEAQEAKEEDYFDDWLPGSRRAKIETLAGEVGGAGLRA
jgi:hypothetical protein